MHMIEGRDVSGLLISLASSLCLFSMLLTSIYSHMLINTKTSRKTNKVYRESKREMAANC